MAFSLKGQLELKPKYANLLEGAFRAGGKSGCSSGKADVQPLPSCSQQVLGSRQCQGLQGLNLPTGTKVGAARCYLTWGTGERWGGSKAFGNSTARRRATVEKAQPSPSRAALKSVWRLVGPGDPFALPRVCIYREAYFPIKHLN